MLQIGGISAIQRIISTFRQAGIRDIVVVTGRQAQELEKHVARSGVICLENREYQTNEMFDSVKIGLAYQQGKCDRVFVTPADIPLFTAETVKKLCRASAGAALPVCGGRTGHPLMLRAAMISKILSYGGQGGLAGAIARFPREYVAVNDRGILFDADTPDDYRALLEYHNRQFAYPEIKINLVREKPFFGEGAALLLRLIGESESVRGASVKTGISYSKCWKILTAIAEQTGKPVVETFQGGSGGGRTRLTEHGILLLRRYHEYCEEVRRLAERAFQKIFGPDFLGKADKKGCAETQNDGVE